MNMTKLHTNYRITPFNGITLQDVRGRTVTCVSGTVWLTMEGDVRDVVLGPGASFVVDRDGLTILAAQKASEVRVTAQNQPRTWWDRVVEYLDQTYGPAAIHRDRAWKYYNERSR